jgi:hypothetical protein
LRGSPRWLAAGAFMLCGFNLHFAAYAQLNSIALLPWCLLAMHWVIDRPTLWRMLGLALVFALQFLGGDATACWHVMLTCALAAAVGLLWLEPRATLRALPAMALAAGLGFALAGAQWLPMLDLMRHAMHEPRGAWRMASWRQLAQGWVGVIPLALALVGINTNAAKMPVRRWLVVGSGMTAMAVVFPQWRLFAATGLALALLAGFGLQALLEGVPKFSGGADAITLSLVHRGEGRVRGGTTNDPTFDEESPSIGPSPQLPTGRDFASLNLSPPLRTGAREKHWLLRRPALWIALMLVELLGLGVWQNWGVDLMALDRPSDALEWLQEQRAAQAESTFRVEGIKALGTQWAIQHGLDNVRADDAFLTQRSRDALDLLGDAAQKASALLALRYFVSELDQPTPAGHRRQVFPPASQPSPTVIDENPAALPPAWAAAAAVAYPTAHEALQRTGKMDFDPHRLVIGDWDVSADQLEWMTRPWDPFVDPPPLTRPTTTPDYFHHGANPPKKNTPSPQITWLEDSPERVRLRLTNGNGSWLVLADTYMDGWEAKVGYPSAPASAQPRLIVPAYGVLRAVPVWESADHAAVDVSFEYHPAAWRRGVLLSAGAAALWCVLLAFALLKPNNGDGLAVKQSVF